MARSQAELKEDDLVAQSHNSADGHAGPVSRAIQARY
jgi:hypothetical protein